MAIKSVMNNKITPSEGEYFIQEYLKFNNISFDTEVTLNHLKFDDANHRRADFYLKKYKVYLEFNGRWNNTKEDRVRYRKKKEVYRKNNLPCIYLYPENLGIIDFVFPKRLIEELQNHSMKRELLKFQFKRFMVDRGGLFFWLFLSLIFLLWLPKWEEDKEIIFGAIAIIGFQLYRVVVGYYKFFIKNEHQF